MRMLFFLFLLIIPIAAHAASGHGIEQLTDMLTKQVSNAQNGNAVQIKLNNHHNIGDFELLDITYGQQKGKMQVHITNDGHPQVLSGMFSVLVKVPVLKTAGHKGQVIKEQDIQLLQVPERTLKYNSITDHKSLVGKELKNNYPANKQLFSKDLRNAQIIKKGAVVAMHFAKRNLHIETKGTALEDGGLGDHIRVKNVSSGKVVQATIVNAGAVVIDGGQ